mmetsp:Transcript_16881/g.46652  ORF Transcript_16881/g.46652 Transcript_16881/m.46652 type:complete len:80 (+) Transcript_16881:812-1051(+)
MRVTRPSERLESSPWHGHHLDSFCGELFVETAAADEPTLDWIAKPPRMTIAPIVTLISPTDVFGYFLYSLSLIMLTACV